MSVYLTASIPERDEKQIKLGHEQSAVPATPVTSAAGAGGSHLSRGVHNASPELGDATEGQQRPEHP